MQVESSVMQEMTMQQEIATWPEANERPLAFANHSVSASLGDERIRYSVPIATRIFEIVVAIVVLALSFPLMLLIAFIIKRGTKGRALFFQKRLGVGAKPFPFVKFRTLYADAKERFPELYAYKYTGEELDALRFKVEVDPRITPQGVWLRKLSIDELPNFWCLLTGDMALVGPRPEIPEMLPYYDEEMRKKFSVRPGITGLAQTSGRGRLTFRQTVAYDLEYVKNRSFLFDIKIILKTVKMVFFRDGAF